MTTDLPRPWRWRRPTLDDADAIYGLVAAHTSSLLGFADVTLDDVRDELGEPGFDPAADGWLVHADGRVAGHGWAYGKGDSGNVDVDVIAAADAVAEWLWRRVLRRAVEMGAKAGHDEVTVDVGIHQADAIQQAAPHHSVSSRRPRSIECVSTSSSHRSNRRFPLMWSYESGRATRRCVAMPTACPPGRSWIISVSSRSRSTSGTRASSRRPPTTGRSSGSPTWMVCRWRWCAVGPVRQRRGPRVHRNRCRARPGPRPRPCQAAAPPGVGRRLPSWPPGSILHVDTNNATPALDLYLGVGMRPVLALDVWRARLPTT